jgi:hypothetical protein
MPALDWTELLRRAGIAEPPGRAETIAAIKAKRAKQQHRQHREPA